MDGLHASDHRVDRPGRFDGMVGGDLTVAAGCAVEMAGQVAGCIILEPGATVDVTGLLGGDVTRAAGARGEPVLTFPDAERACLRDAYAGAEVVLEYGTGGSTLLAVDLGVPHLIAVESDADWLADVRRHVEARAPETRVDLHHGDIGPTKKWGSPRDHSRWNRYHRYPTDVWDQPFFAHPDVVLIDGRFRAACLLTVMTRITRPVTVLFDDYRDRAQYARVEDFAQPARMVGRIAVFDLAPRPFDPAKLTGFVDAFTRVR